MGKYTSYYLYQKYEKIGSQDWTPVYPQTLSVYSDGTESGSTNIKSDNDISCGYKPTQEVKYRWVKLNPSTDYICDNCELWVASGYICDNGDLYEQLNEQNFDGKNWYFTGVKKKGKLIEENSKKCTGDTGTTTGSTTGSTTGGTTGSTTGGTTGDTGTTTGGTLSMKVTYTDGSEKKFYNLTSINSDTDSNKSNAKSVEIYDGVTSIGFEAFCGSSSLTSITIPNSVTTIGERAFEYCSSLSLITIPNSVTSIGRLAFAYCTKLTSITLSDNLTSIGEQAFQSCSGLTSITIPDKVRSIDNSVFYKCPNLTEITIPNSVTNIGTYAFGYCTNLTELTVKASTPPTLGGNAFADSGIQTIYVPASSVNAYKSADGWSTYASKIQAIP